MDLKLQEEDDGLYFADLNKQISLLIMDDEDQSLQPLSFSSNPPTSLQAASHASQPAGMPFPAVYELYMRTESKGTGVFIPRATLPRKKCRSGRANAPHRQMAKSEQNPNLSSFFDNRACICCSQRPSRG
ncbi:uncharacterized protein LOC116259880 [Nymphaea colorata]|nr:uncharacterized protein LOC116259880 [Nymphaea colorata]XP_031493717.1 uncharacterized protein LOC116259880 [Nymphaea colorata]